MSKISIAFFLFLILFSSCNNTKLHEKELDLENFSQLRQDIFNVDYRKIHDNIETLMMTDGRPISIDRRFVKYYSDGNPFIWIDRLGVKNRVDTLLKILRCADFYGLDTNMLRIGQIENDLKLIRTLNFNTDDINVIMARLEYNLTRAYFRYSIGVAFGFINPDYLYNTLEKYDVDSITTRFRQLSDLRVKRPDSIFYNKVINYAFHDSISYFLRIIHPKDDLYENLLERLNNDDFSKNDRMKILCNIERCRWKLKDTKQNLLEKYIEVNIPSFSLRAIDKGKVLSMRVGCGTLKSKTPLLASQITRMDVNPQWIVPKSISKGFANNYSYMHKMGMFVFDKREGKLPPEEASYSKIMAGKQYIIQAGGPKNSLGRIIFRFDNNFSVFLHDTSSPWIFKRDRRAVSHGCVRVEKPYELALFLFDKRDENLEERLKYSMSVDFVNDKDSLEKKGIKTECLVSTIPVNPSVPLFITYYTVYYDNDGKIVNYQDVYGYDEVLAERLKPFVK